jgi:hypothetical protein
VFRFGNLLRSARLLQEPSLVSGRDAFLRLFSTVLVEEALVYLETVPRDQIVVTMRPLLREFRATARELGEPQIMAPGYLSLAGAYNINRRYLVGQILYKRAFELLDTVDAQLRALRGIAIAGIFLGDKVGVELATSETIRRVEEGNFTRLEQVCETMEGVSRARGLLGIHDAFYWFEEAEKILERLTNHPLRKLQMITSKLEVLLHLDPNSTIDIQKLASAGLSIATTFEYSRHQRLISELLGR